MILSKFYLKKLKLKNIKSIYLVWKDRTEERRKRKNLEGE